MLRELLEVRLGALAVMAPTVFAVAMIVAVVLQFVRRRWPPREPLAPRRQSLLTDLGYMFLSPASEGFARTVAMCVLGACAWLIGQRVGPELLEGFGPLRRQPQWAQVVEILLLGDLLYYWIHRLAHTWPLLWRVHAIHHSTRHMRPISAMRAHPGEAYVQAIQLIPLFLLGLPLEALFAIAPFSLLYALFIHSNLNVSLGPLRFILNTPAFHRWHHALEGKTRTTNFAGWFTFYDVLFGTYRLSSRRPAELGIDEPAMPTTCFGQLAHPFRRRR